jgi:REP element-mobilizing transposase RayT
MPRQLRIQYPGAMYHVMSRGNRRAAIFLDDVDRQDFLKTLAEACQKTSWQIHAYCLMSNHYHLVLETPNANLVAGMAWLQSTYTIRLNHRHKLMGHVLSGRYKAQLVEGSGNGYLRTACDYVHLNPVRAGLLKPGERLLQTEGQLGEHHFGELRRETAEAKGQRIIAEELGRLGWKEADLATRRKSDPAKLQIAARLRKETTFSIKQIAGCLHLGTPRSASVRLHTVMRGTAPAGSVQPCLGI